jgi:acyl-CoA synthetase (AMP-forming)/AMP-acid ligase II
MHVRWLMPGYGGKSLAVLLPAAGPLQVRTLCTGNIAHYKIPRYVRVADDFLMTVTGQVQKFKMREASVTEFGLEPASQPDAHRLTSAGPP